MSTSSSYTVPMLPDENQLPADDLVRAVTFIRSAHWHIQDGIRNLNVATNDLDLLIQEALDILDPIQRFLDEFAGGDVLAEYQAARRAVILTDASA